jgi:DNA replication and repair protein RecF
MLSELHLQHFRNHEQVSFHFGAQTIIVGPNGAGKTNVLEAVSMLSLTTSWRTTKDSEVVTWDTPFARVISGERELVIQRKPYLKRVRIDGVSKRVGEVVGTLPTVLFQPDDSQLISGSPSYRRAAVDRLLSQVVPGYLTELSRLQRVLKQRNKLLKRIQDGEASSTELDYWNEQLAECTAQIREAREVELPKLAEAVQGAFAELVPQSELVTLTYQASPATARSTEEIASHLAHNQHKEIAAGVTLYGPQREDILFTWGSHPAAEGMSRGQVRALVLAFKLAEVACMEQRTGMAPILLLDDVYSEFDKERRQAVTTLTRKYQSILTTTDLDGMEHDIVIQLP